MSRLKRNISIIRSLNHLNPKQYKAVLQHSDKDLIYCLSNVIDNVSTGRIKVKPSTLKRLRRYKRDIYQICDEKLPYKKRKSIIAQKGAGLFSVLLPSILGTLVSLVSGAIKRKKKKKPQ